MTNKSVDQSALNADFEFKNQKQAILDILNYVAAHNECKFLELADLFCASGVSGYGHARSGFKGRLLYLVTSEQLAAKKGVPRNIENWTFSLGPMAGKLTRLRKAPAESAASQPKQRAPRRNYAPMPPNSRELPRMTALRPGADEFVAAPSLRNGQRLPFTGGYVAAGSK